MPFVALIALAAVLHGGCRAPCHEERPPDDSGLDSADTDTDVDPTSCPDFSAPQQVGALSFLGLDNLSGLAASQRHDAILWAHNDSGDTPRVFALDEGGALVAEIALAAAEAQDWEDIAVGPGPGGQPHVYVGDIGDRFGGRDHVTVYRFAEPDLPAGGWGVETAWFGFEGVYPDHARDAEALLVDPVEQIIYLVTRNDDGATELFRYPPNTRHGVRSQLEPLGALVVEAFASSDSPQVTGGDISADGSMIVLRTQTAALLWMRGAGTVLEALSTEPCVVPLAEEPQGEAIAFEVDGLGLLTSSEGVYAPLHRIGITPGE